MKKLTLLSIVLGLISIIIGIISRLIMSPILVEASSYLQFSHFCFLAAITFILYKMGFKDTE